MEWIINFGNLIGIKIGSKRNKLQKNIQKQLPLRMMDDRLILLREALILSCTESEYLKNK